LQFIWGNESGWRNTANTGRRGFTPQEGLNQSKTVVFILWINFTLPRFSRSSSPNIYRLNIDRGALRRGKRSRSVREDHGTLDVRRQGSSWHSVHLWVIDIHHGGRWRSEDAAPEGSTRAPCASAWTQSMFSSKLIDTGWCLFKIRSLSRALHLHRRDHLGNPSHDIHPPAIV
jgi:hypothetical protein